MKSLYEDLHGRLEDLSRNLNRFIAAVEVKRKSVREESGDYLA